MNEWLVFPFARRFCTFASPQVMLVMDIHSFEYGYGLVKPPFFVINPIQVENSEYGLETTVSSGPVGTMGVKLEEIKKKTRV